VAGSAVDEIKARLDVADVVGAHVPLKRSGRSLKGLCPFHAERTPSFYAFPDTGTWKCFGCGEGGDIFTFIQKRENLEFGETLRMLASRAGVELPTRESRTPEAQAADERLLSVLRAAERYFKATLQGNAGSAARAYLDQRGVSQESLERFAVGYAPARGLLTYLESGGFSPDEATEVGLAGRRGDGSVFEMFRERVIFPIRNTRGETIGFGGRTLGESQPKYLNGPQTRFFDKSSSLFALDLARSAIRQSGQAIIVEGYLDAILVHQYGSQNVVATLGTALTERHLDILGRRATEIILALDADAAGQAATLRGLEVAQQAPADAVVPVPAPGVRGWIRYQAVRKCQVKVLTLPPGMDPDDLVRGDAAEWRRLVDQATPVVDFLLTRLGERHDLATFQGKREAVQEAMGVIRDLPDPVEREHYLQRLAAIVGLDESGLRLVLNRLRPRSTSQALTAVSREGEELPEAYALALFFIAGTPSSTLSSDDITSPEGRAIYGLFTQLDESHRGEPALANLAESVDPDLRPALGQVLAWLPRMAALSHEQRDRELEVVALKLRQQRLRLRHQEVLALASQPDASLDQTPPASMLAAIAAQLKEIEGSLAARDGIGSLVWRSREVGEVLGG
jgi:DNA primase